MTRVIKTITIHGVNIVINRNTGEGLKELYLRINPKISSLARQYYVIGKDYDDRKQDLQIKVWQILKVYNSERGSFYTFTMKCLNNYIRNEIDYNKRRIQEENNIPDCQLECADISINAMFMDGEE